MEIVDRLQESGEVQNLKAQLREHIYNAIHSIEPVADEK